MKFKALKWLNRSAKRQHEAPLPEVNVQMAVLAADQLMLIRQINEAKAEWNNALHMFDFVTDPEQIDYAIYVLGAAEKRYGMLLRQAKKTKVTLYNARTGKVAEA